MKSNKDDCLTENLIKTGVTKLKKFGFVNVNKTNITRDEVYSFYFSKILYSMLGNDSEADVAIGKLQESMNNLINKSS